jgi:hypothetical protein
MPWSNSRPITNPNFDIRQTSPSEEALAEKWVVLRMGNR